MYKVKQYQQPDKDTIIDLMGVGLYKNKIWDWQYYKANDRAFNPVVIENDQAKIVGFNGCMPTQLSFQKPHENAAWSCDFFVAKECRGEGVGRIIKEELQDRFDILTTLGVSEQAAPVLLKMGWTRINGVKPFYFHTHGKGFKGAVKRYLHSISRTLFGAIRLPSSIKLTYQRAELKDNLDELSNLYNRYKSSSVGCVERTKQYMQWRYLTHTSSNYSLITACKNNVISGALIYKISGDSIMIVDYIGPDAITLKTGLINNVLYTHKSQVKQFDTYTSDKNLKCALLLSGFLPGAGEVGFYVWQKRESSVPNTWFVMPSDSDGELLRSAQYYYKESNN